MPNILLLVCFIAYAHCVFLGVCYKKPSFCELKANLLSDLETEQNRMNARCKTLQALNNTQKFYSSEVSNGLKKCEEELFVEIAVAIDKCVRKLGGAN